MTLFRISSRTQTKPESPVLMFRDLRRDPSIKYLWGHQEKLLDEYFTEHLKRKDLAIELPTGAGKTLVGLLIAEFRRRASDERCVFLCPTRQLCCQVDAQARKYGITTSLLIGSGQNYDPVQFYKYQQAKAIAITTYWGIFNVHPRIDDPEVIICDDAHTADDSVASLWTVLVEREKHREIYQAIFRNLQHAIPENMAHSIQTYDGDLIGKPSPDLVSTISLYGHHNSLKQILDELILDTDLRYSWSNISSHLDACLLYCSPDAFEIRPIIPPTLTHNPFSQAHQRIYMSATLGEDGDIERSFGVRKIARLPIPEGWDKRGTGRRLVLFPGLSGDEDTELEATVTVLNKVDRSLILVPDNRTRKKLEDALPNTFKVLGSTDIEKSIDAFTKHPAPVVLLIANRYNGIDLPGNDCRVMVLWGLPTGVGLQEKYLLKRLGAVSLLRDRIRTRITQAMGRCTRDESDYSIVLLLGDDLLKWFCTRANIGGMHPELQAEIDFGMENSPDRTKEEFVEICTIFLSRTAAWQQCEQAIQDRRNAISKVKDATADALARAASLEIDYLYKSWDGQHEEAFTIATKVIDMLEGGSVLNPYRSFWHHQAAVSSFLAWKASNNDSLRLSVISHLKKASETSRGVNWLAKLQAQLTGKRDSEDTQQTPLQEWFSEISSLLEEWRILGRRYTREIVNTQHFIQSTEAKVFEKGLALLGRMLGAKTHQWNSDGAPDGLWIFGDWHAFVFEAKTDAKPEGSISLEIVRQAATHEERVRSDKLIPQSMPCSTIIISPRRTLQKVAVPHTKDMSYIRHEEVVQLFENAASALEQVRAAALGSTEETLQTEADRIYSAKRIRISEIKDFLLKMKLSALPIVD